jgi:hypothetical protein
VNVASAELDRTPLRASGPALGVGIKPEAGSNLNGFLSLVTGFLEKIPAISPPQMEVLSPTPSHASGARIANKDKSEDSINKVDNATINRFSTSSLQAPVVFLTHPAVAPEFSTPWPDLAARGEPATSGENKSDGAQRNILLSRPGPRLLLRSSLLLRMTLHSLFA